jgi:peptide/nickel transport system ATP-binding protein
MSSPLMTIERLRVELMTGDPVISSLSLSLDHGAIVGIVGESGSGKTTMALACLGYARPGSRIAQGTVRINDEEVLGRTDRELRTRRGKLVSYVPQDPAASLNPSIRIGDLIRETVHTHLPAKNASQEVARVLDRLHLPSDRDFQRRFPHQLSGGQQQRVAIALALVCEPPLVVMDEPTTGLDVVTQARILDEIQRLRHELAIGIVYVSHDLAVVGNLADRIAVMYGGWIVEEGPTETILQAPKHPYTQGLIASIPDHFVARRLRGIPGLAAGVGEQPPGCVFYVRCPQRCARGEREMPDVETIDRDHSTRCFEWQRTPPLPVEPAKDTRGKSETAHPLLEVEALYADYRIRTGVVVAAQDVSFSIGVGGSIALVGESGSGKTTIARCISGLHLRSGGRVVLNGNTLPPLAKDRSRDARRRIQIVFQNPYDSLNPRHRIGDAIAFAARLLRNMNRDQAKAEALELLERVRLPARIYSRYPAELSGGERQRVAIARALAAHPDILICDEITSALDVSIQAAVVELLQELRQELGLALLFISHDLGVVASIAEYALVLHNGVVREEGPVATLVNGPMDEYTRKLIDAAPRLPSIRAGT